MRSRLIIAMVVVGLSIGWTATALALDGGWFETVDHLERRADGADARAQDTRQRAEELEKHLTAGLTDADTARRATEELRADVATQYARWDAGRRKAGRLQRGAASSEGRAMQRSLEVAGLPATDEWRRQIELLSEVAAGVEHAGALLVRRGELEVDYAYSRGVQEGADAARAWVVERASNGDGADDIPQEVQDVAEELSAQLALLNPLPAVGDFHRNKGALFPPVSATPTHSFGPRRRKHSYTEVRHTGVTYEIAPGAEVRSVASGTVVMAKRMVGYGKILIVDHGGEYHSVYAHLDEFSVGLGDEIEERQKIGKSGDTGSLEGPKLYFELRRQGRPVDPEEWFVSQ